MNIRFKPLRQFDERPAFDARVVEDVVVEARGQVPDRETSDDTGFARGDYVGRYGRLSLASDGSWVYTLDAARSQALREGEIEVETFTVYSATGLPETVTIEVLGSNDAARISGDTSATVHEGGTSLARGRLVIDDVDRGEAAVRPQDVRDAYGVFRVGADGEWEYRLDQGAEAVRALEEGQTLVRHFDVVSLDGSATRRIEVTIVGQGARAQLSGGDAALCEDALDAGLSPSAAGTEAQGRFGTPAPGQTLRLSAPGSALTSGGEAVSWSLSADGRTLTGATRRGTVLEVKVDDDWNWHARLRGAIDHGYADEVLRIAAVVYGRDGDWQGQTQLALTLVDGGVAADAQGDLGWQVVAGRLGRFGADGGRISHIAVDGVRYDYTTDGSVLTNASPGDYRFDSASKTLLVRGEFGQVRVKLDDASYDFHGREGHSTPVRLDYGLRDGDGDGASGSVRFVPATSDPSPIPPAGPEGGSYSRVYSCGAWRTQIDGSDGDDELVGTAGLDILRGGRGRDRLFGGDDDDTLEGGEDDDILSGGRGNDRLWGGSTGNDILVGGDGDDMLFASSRGRSRLFGGDGDDYLQMRSGHTEMEGGRGRDSFWLDLGWMAPRSDGDRVTIISDFTRGEDRLALVRHPEGMELLLERVGQDTRLTVSGYESADRSGPPPVALTVLFRDTDLLAGQSSHDALEALRTEGAFII